MRRLVLLAAVVGLVVPTFGEVLGNPYDSLSVNGVIAQDFVWPGTEALSAWAVSDFTTTQDYILHDVSSLGWATNTGNMLDGTGANFDIYNGLPWEGGTIVTSSVNGYDTLRTQGIMGADFDGFLLPAGSYYMVFQSVHQFLPPPGGNTLAYLTFTGGSDDWQWNPGLGQNWGSDHRPAVTAASEPADANWQLNATPVPEPSGLLLLGVAALLRRRR